LPNTPPTTTRPGPAAVDASGWVAPELGGVFNQQGVCPRRSAHAAPRFHEPRQKGVEHFPLLQLAQAGSIGRGDVDRKIARQRSKGFNQAHIIRDAIAAVLVGADIDPDDAAFVPARGEPTQYRVGALAAETQPT